jgi:hypothetical protein
MVTPDENIRLVEEARELLLKKHGGYKGLWEFLLREDEARRKQIAAKRKRNAPKKLSRKKPARQA